MFCRRHHDVAPDIPAMRPPVKSAAEALAESPLAGLLDQARLLGRIASAVAEISSEGASGTHSLPPPRCSLDGRTVIITVGTPSQAAKLRQRAAALDRAIRERLPELTAIRIRLQPGSLDDPSPATAPGDGTPSSGPVPVPPASLAAALRFADDLSRELHDSPLRRSALRLQASLRAKLGRGR
jgi:hypothetical protein